MSQSPNIDLALRTAQELVAHGVREICLCAGARNSPLITVLGALSEAGHLRAYHYFEERSAAFFALGRAKAEGRPVAVITTSGTAVAELLPAVIEAHYTGTPLVMVTADRPRKYRGTGAPQAIEQKGIFGSYVAAESDIEAGEPFPFGFSEVLARARQGVAHINLCFEEPLLERKFSPDEWETSKKPRIPTPVSMAASARARIGEFLSALKCPLVIVGGIESSSAREAVATFLRRLGAPVYLEGVSGLRERPELQALALGSSDRILGTPMASGIDGVLRIGGVPTLRFWRDLDGKRADLPLLSVSDLPFAGTARGVHIEAPLAEVFDGWSEVAPVATAAALLEQDRRMESQILELLREEGASEPGMILAWSERLPVRSRVYLGNSLPIREWDLAATRADRGFVMGANRGANGIDGQTSTFFGFCRAGQPNWALLGDLTAMYDLPAPWVLPQLDAGVKAQLVVMNNGGGRIFSRIFGNPLFENQHGVGFEDWARMWAMQYERWERIPESLPEFAGHAVIELKPDAVATARFWERYDSLWRR